MSCLMALPPQVQPLMPTLSAERPSRSNQPPHTRYCPSPSAQMVYTEFLVVTRTRSPHRRSLFRTCSSDWACSTRAARVSGMQLKSLLLPLHPSDCRYWADSERKRRNGLRLTASRYCRPRRNDGETTRTQDSAKSIPRFPASFAR